MERKIRRSLGFVMITVVLVLITVFCFAGTVLSQTDIGIAEQEKYFASKEKELVKETREFLKEKGYPDSGVTLTRVVEETGEREYTVTVHHGKIDRMDEDSRDMLKQELEKVVFMADNCTFYHEFLVTQQ